MSTKANPKSKASSNSEDEPLKVAVVPNPPETDGETQEPANVDNRNKSYLPPVEAVNMNDPESAPEQ